MTNPTDESSIPSDTLDAIVELVATGPVSLGGYTLAEIDAVGGIKHLFEDKPDPALLAEAVRSLAARNLITTEAGSDQLEIRGDLGIVTAFQFRARTVLDARTTGAEPDQPWRSVLMPQPEGVTLEVLIDTLGIHLYSLRSEDQALERLWARLPSGKRGPEDADADAVLDASSHTALLSASHWDASGDRETHDVVLAEDGDVCHVFVRDPDEPARLVAAGMDQDEWRDMVSRLASTGS